MVVKVSVADWWLAQNTGLGTQHVSAIAMMIRLIPFLPPRMPIAGSEEVDDGISQASL